MLGRAVEGADELLCMAERGWDVNGERGLLCLIA